MDRRRSKKKTYSGAMTPGVVATLALVGVFAIVLVVFALIRGTM